MGQALRGSSTTTEVVRRAIRNGEAGSGEVLIDKA